MINTHRRLTRMVPWSHSLLGEVLSLGDTAVDLTAGQGRDTLALAHAVGRTGRVIAFDVQRQALDQTAKLLRDAGFSVFDWVQSHEVPDDPGIYLIHACHSTLADFFMPPIQAVVANLGYLPGSDFTMITRPETTCRSLQTALDLLRPGGRLAVTAYHRHPGAEEEAKAVEQLICSLPRNDWQVLRLVVANIPEAPSLLVAERTIR